MSEAQIGRKNSPSPTGEVGTFRPEVSRQFPRVRLVPEQTTQSRQEGGFIIPGVAQETSLPVDVLRTDLSKVSISAETGSIGSNHTQSPKKDLYAYVQEKVASGELTSEQGLNILGVNRTEVQQQAVIDQIQAQEQQAEAIIRELGIADEVKRLREIETELPQSLIPIEGTYHQQEWRERKELKSGKPWQRLYGQIADVFVVDNPDGTQTQYVDRTPRWYHRTGLVSMKEGVYEETYGSKGKFGKRKLLERKRVGNHIEQIGWEQPENEREKPREKYAVVTDRYLDLLDEQFLLQTEIQEKEKARFFSKIDMGGTDYIPSKKEKQRVKSVEDSITRILWSVKDTPKEQRIFMARNIATNFVFYSLFQTIMPDLGLLGTPLAGVAGATYSVGSYYGLFSWKDVGKYLKDHPVATAVSAGTMGLFFFNPAFGLAAFGAQYLWGMRELPKQIATNMKLKQEFKKNHSEITEKKEFNKAFNEYKFEELQRRARVEFAEKQEDWLIKLKELNPNTSEDILMQAMLMRAGEFGQGMKELQQIMQKLVNNFMISSSWPRFGVLAFAKPIELGASFVSSLFGLPPIVGRLAAAAVMSSASTGLSMYAIQKTMPDMKTEIAERYPHLIPLSERKPQQS